MEIQPDKVQFFYAHGWDKESELIATVDDPTNGSGVDWTERQPQSKYLESI